MKTVCPLSIVFFTLITISSGAENPKAASLPKDGAWVRYYVHTSDSNDNQQIERYTIKLVGTQRENGETHRWLEFKRTKGKKVEREFVFKLLISEKELLTGTNPIAHAVRIWEKIGTGKVQSVLPILLHPNIFDVNFGPKFAFLPGPMQQAKKSEQQKSVDYQEGRLEMKHGYSTKHIASYRSKISNDMRVWTTDITSWRHQKIPFGFAAAKMTSKLHVDGKFRFKRTAEYTIEAWGKDAKTELPKHR